MADLDSLKLMLEPFTAGPTPDYLGYGFALMLFLGGLVGAVRKGSFMSLLGGGLFAAFQVYGSQLVTYDRTDILPALYTNIALCILMTYRFVMSEKFMPGGMLSVSSTACDPETRYPADAPDAVAHDDQSLCHIEDLSVRT